MELGFKPGTVGSKALELDLLAVGEKGRLGRSPALSDLLKTMGGERRTWRPTHSILAWEITWSGSLVIYSPCGCKKITKQ